MPTIRYKIPPDFDLGSTVLSRAVEHVEGEAYIYLHRQFCVYCGASFPHVHGEGRCPQCAFAEHLQHEEV